MSLLCRGTVVLLALMLVQAAVIVFDRLSRYSQARRQSRRFVRDASSALGSGSFAQALSVAAQNPRSHIAAVVSAGLASFGSTPTHFTHVEAVTAAERAMLRYRETASAGLRVGLNTLASIAANAPFVGLFGTVIGILNAFKGCSGQRWMCIAATVDGLAQALVMTASGLFVAIPAVWFRDYLRGRMELFESEMSNAAIETVTLLHSHRRETLEVAFSENATLSDVPDKAAARAWEIPYDRSRVLLGALWLCLLYLGFQTAYATYRATIRWSSYTEYDPDWERVGGYETFSPDGRYRAVVPAFYRRTRDSASEKPDCGEFPRISIKIFSNEHLAAWSRRCPNATGYPIQANDALLTWNCRVPFMLWRAHDELLVQCNDCSVDELQLIERSTDWPRITIVDSDGKQLHPKMLRSESRCGGP